MALPTSMKAVIFDGPFKISVQDRPVPAIRDARDIVVRVNATALCGSDLHLYRGLEPCATGHIMGHEFAGTVVQVGDAVKQVKVGDEIVSPFTISCGECFYCKCGDTARCTECKVLGTPMLDGAQAQYVRVPLADTTVMKAPRNIPEQHLVLMADIFPTGYYGSTMVIIGCGPVGLCAVIAALEHRPKHLFAVDSVESRLEIAKKLGAEPLDFTKKDKMLNRIKEVTDGRGADIVVEVVGLSPALRTAFDVVRPFGVISSIGVHSAEIPWSATEGYDKNLRLQMGRCPVRKVFAESLELLEKKHHLFDFMFDKIMPLTAATEAYDLFDKRQAQKVVFTP